MAQSAKAKEIVEAARTPPTSPEMVRAWFVLLSSFLNWHPDTEFSQYVEHATGERVFSNRDVRVLDMCMAQCFEVCSHDPGLIYNLGLETLKESMGDQAKGFFEEEIDTVEADHWSSPNGCHPDCPACAANRTEEETQEQSIIEKAGLHAKDLLSVLENLIGHLTEAHQDELNNNHHGDSSCSYCAEIAKARALILKVDRSRPTTKES